MKLTARPQVLGYAAAIIGVALMTLLRWALDPIFGASGAFLTFYAAVALAAVVGGMWPGLFAALLSLMVGLFLIVPPLGHLHVGHSPDVARLLLFVLVAIFISLLSGALHAALKRVQRSEAEYRGLFDFSASGNAEIDLSTGRFLRVNDRYCEIIGYSREELLAMRLHDVTAPEDQAKDREQFEEMARGETTEFFREKVYVRKDGRRIWGEVRAGVLRDENGVPRFAFGVVNDIDRRKRAEEALRENEQHMRAIFDNAALGIVEVDQGDRFVAANDRVCQILGYRREELLGMTVHELTAPEDRSRSDELNAQVHAGQQNQVDYEKRYLRRDGTSLWVHVTVSCMRDSAGRYVRGIGTIEDIAERKAAEEALYRAKQEWERTFDAVPDLISIIDMQHHLVRVNRAMATRIGATPDQCPGLFCYQCMHGRSEPIKNCPHDLAMADGREHIMEVYEERLGGYFLISCSPLFDAGGKMVGTVHVARDISERKRAEESLLAAKASAEHAAAELALSNKDLEQFAYVASHDLQEPLRMVSGFMSLLRNQYRSQLDDRAQEYISFAVDGAQRMQRLVHDLLEYSRVSSRGRALQPVAMQEVYDRAAADLWAKITECEATVTHDPLPEVLGDETQLAQVLLNLIGNALKFRAPGRKPSVHVGARKTTEGWLFSVADNGIGIGPEHFERIFLLFQRLHGKEEYEGTGIGLAIVKKIVERHGGEVCVDSRIDQGTTFHFTLQDTQAASRALPVRMPAKAASTASVG